MSAKSNKSLIRRYFKAIDTGDVRVLEKFVSPAFVNHDPSAGQPADRKGLKQSFLASQESLPGYHTVDELIAEGDKVVARVTGYGTHEGTYHGVPATGRKVRMSGIVIWRIRSGKIVERWSASHVEDLMRQIQTPRKPRR